MRQICFILHARGIDADTLSLTARWADGAFSLFGKCIGGVLREKNEALRPFSKVDEVDLCPGYYLGDVEFGS